MASLYEIPIEKLNGIGGKRVRLFNKLGIVSIGDLIRYYPRTYENWSEITCISDITVGETCCIKATLDLPVASKMLPSGLIISTSTISDETGTLKLVFFNNKYISSMLKKGKEYLFYGKITESMGFPQMVSPIFQNEDSVVPIHPIYGQTAGLTSRTIESAVKKALEILPAQITDTIPEDIRTKYDLMGMREAIVKIHFPENSAEIESAKRRLIFEELLVLMLGLSSMKKETNSTDITITKNYTDEFVSMLPFKLTNAQQKAIDVCISDMMTGSHAMNRLVQGDVGSGKTMVAAAVAYTCIKNGYQAAMMAPTEILAKQHYENFQKLFEGTDVKVRLLTGSTTQKQKREILDFLESGYINFVVGTHALISENVEFKNLGIVITDEQHRFGVRQRSNLQEKGTNPHLLVMSATPIPRTLALMIYGDLDISVIDELPPGRQKVDTFFIDSSIRERAYNFLKKNIDEGRQCYIVCPAVEHTDGGLRGVEEYAEDIAKNDFKNYTVGVLHGQMKAAEKEAVMNDFIEGKISVLVSTTVIEVGVDVPNSTIMMIENAERFGLSQLHQLRGRVGRGKYKSYCILVSDAKGEDAIYRMKVLCSTNNGFKIADEDLKLRGPGDFFGSRQHGLPELKIADFMEDIDILRDAQAVCGSIIPDYMNPENSDYKGLRAEVRQLFTNVGNQLIN